MLHQCFDEDTVYHILRLPLHLNSSSDRWIWVLDKSGRYSTKSMYNHLVPPFNEAASPLNEQQWKALWKLKVHARQHLLLWKISWNILPTRTRIAAIISSGAPPNCLCPLCGVLDESTTRLFLDCSYRLIVEFYGTQPLGTSLLINSWVFQ